MAQVTVEDLENPNKEVEHKPEKAQEKVSEAQYASLDELQKIQKQLNGLSYMGRKFDEMTRKLDALGTPQQNVGPTVRPEDMDEYDKLVEKDWKAAVRKLAQEEAATLRKQEREEEFTRQAAAKQANLLEQSKKSVLDRYPQLSQDDSEISIKFKEVVARHPEYTTNEFGPILAMRDMEEELKSEGKLDTFSKKVVDKEIERRARVGVASVPKASPASGSKSTLSAEDKKFCDFNGIKYDVFLRNKQSLSSAERQAEG
jgi:hypothetical protein